MSVLSGATKSAPTKAFVMTFLGDAGSGKTSLACEFSDAFLIRTTGEAVPRDVTNVPDSLDAIGWRMTEGDVRIWDENELFDQLTALVRDEHNYKTLVIDSVTGLEALFVKNILDVQPERQRTMNAAGKGFASEWDNVAAKHGRVRKAAEILRDKRGMNVIFLCHADVDRVEPPDSEPYTKHTLQLHKKTAPVYVNQSDVVGFVHQEVFTVGDGDVKKAKTSGARVIGVDLTPANVSKNRLGLTGKIKYEKGTNPFQEFL